MTPLKSHIKRVITGETSAGPLLQGLLTALAALYRVAVRLRGVLYDRGVFPVHTLPCGVVSIGNLAAGGTGKTPMTLYLARLLQDQGYHPAVISRGYGGNAEKTGTVVSDGRQILAGPEIAGDEPVMMARHLNGIPVLAGADRYAVGMKAMALFSPDVIVLDDGFQHRRLHRDLDVVLVDSQGFFGNRCLLPRGILREPLAGVSRADILVLTRWSDGKAHRQKQLSVLAPDKPVFRAVHAPYVAGIYSAGDYSAGSRPGEGNPASEVAFGMDFLKTEKVFVFSGIAGNTGFKDTVAELAGEVAGSLGFGDHHAYTRKDLQMITARAAASGARYLVTTEKDYVKIAGKIGKAVHNPVDVSMDIVVLGIWIFFLPDAPGFDETIQKNIASITKT